MSRAGLDLKYDGIIFQQVGELLLNVEATRDIRAQCADSYWQSLNNFVFGAVFGANFPFRAVMRCCWCRAAPSSYRPRL